MESSWLHPREELVRAMQRIYRYRMTTTSGGNLSILDPDGSIWITSDPQKKTTTFHFTVASRRAPATNPG